jgi:hypothetical protein
MQEGQRNIAVFTVKASSPSFLCTVVHRLSEASVHRTGTVLLGHPTKNLPFPFLLPRPGKELAASIHKTFEPGWK